MSYDPFSGQKLDVKEWIGRFKSTLDRRFATPEQAVIGIEQALNGKLRSYGSLTLDAGTAATTFVDSRIGPASYIGLMPTTANAAAEIGAGTCYISARTNGSATITHANNANADKSFMTVVIGG